MENFKVYIHGRPQGQDCYHLWDTNDRFYIEPYLDMRIGHDFNSTLISDKFQGNSYYTYIVNSNVVEYSARRPNSYFAITVRFDNCYCRRTHLLYELLDAVYKQKCVGAFVQSDASVTQFLVKKLSEKENVLRDIQAIIRDNVERLLSSHMSPIEKSTDTTASVPKYYSLEEVDSPLYNSEQLTSKVVISPDIPTAVVRLNSLTGIKTQYENLQAAYKEQSDANRKLQEERDSLKKKLNEDSHMYSKSAATIAAQKKEIEGLRSDKKMFQVLETNKESIKQFARLVASRFPESFQDISKENNTDGNSVYTPPAKSPLFSGVKDWIHLVSYVLLLVLIGFNIYVFMDVKGSVDELDKTLSKIAQDTTTVDTLGNIPPPPAPVVSIGVGNYNGGKLTIGKTYPLTVKVNDERYAGGKFEVVGGTVDNNNILAVVRERVKISYIKDGNVLKSRELEAEKRSGGENHNNQIIDKQKEKTNPLAGEGVASENPSEKH